MFTAAEWVRRMKVLANAPNSAYRAKYPYNMLYWDGTRWWGDCVNMQKALFNGRSVDNPVVGSYCNYFSETGDCTEWGLMAQCSDISRDFTKLKTGEPRLLYMEGHIGAYIGEEVKTAKGICNAIECTAGFEQGIVYSYVDAAGRRYNAKGSYQSGSWTHHGKATKWVIYPAAPQPTPTPTPQEDDIMSKLPELKKGSAGNVVKNLQALLNAWMTKSEPLELDGQFGDYTEQRLKEYQSIQGLAVDGVCGPYTWADILLG